MQNTILHLDMDSFFASVEQQANPALVAKPVGVIKGPGRTCIIAASREAKKLGIKTGTTTYEAKRIYPRIALVPADFDKYFSVTKKFVEICSRYAPDLEVFSIDELFLEITRTKGLFGGTLAVCQKIKESIKKEIGSFVTCSIGISYNRLLAKLASGIKKPDGIFEITPTNRDEVLFSCKLTDICGIGERLQKKLFNLGITNFKSLREVPLSCLIASLGPYWPERLKKLSYGEDDSLLVKIGDLPVGEPGMKSVSRTYTLYENTTDLTKIRGILRNLSEEVAFKARELGARGRIIGLGLGGQKREKETGEWQRAGDYKRQTLKSFVNSGKEIFEIIWRLFERESLFDWQFRFLGIWLGGLTLEKNLTLRLFNKEKRQEDLILAMDSINKRFGELTLYPGAMLSRSPSAGLGQGLLKSEVNGFLGDKNLRFPSLG